MLENAGSVNVIPYSSKAEITEGHQLCLLEELEDEELIRQQRIQEDGGLADDRWGWGNLGLKVMKQLVAQIETFATRDDEMWTRISDQALSMKLEELRSRTLTNSELHVSLWDPDQSPEV